MILTASHSWLMDLRKIQLEFRILLEKKFISEKKKCMRKYTFLGSQLRELMLPAAAPASCTRKGKPAGGGPPLWQTEGSGQGLSPWSYYLAAAPSLEPPPADLLSSMLINVFIASTTFPWIFCYKISQIDQHSKTVTTEICTELFTKLGKLLLKFMWKSKMILKGNNVENLPSQQSIS